MIQTDYPLLQQQLQAVCAGEPDALANSANFVALLFDAMADVNWLGIYVLRGDELVLGPFQGKTACVRIPLGRGVCGTAADDGETQRVEDVHLFDGHIACDPLSRSELVVPITVGGSLIGVLDVDSPSLNRFSKADQLGVESLCRQFESIIETANGFI